MNVLTYTSNLSWKAMHWIIYEYIQCRYVCRNGALETWVTWSCVILSESCSTVPLFFRIRHTSCADVISLMFNFSVVFYFLSSYPYGICMYIHVVCTFIYTVHCVCRFGPGRYCDPGRGHLWRKVGPYSDTYELIDDDCLFYIAVYQSITVPNSCETL